MTGADFAAWVAVMGLRGWSKRRCARELGCGKGQIEIWSRTGAPPYIGQACAALAAELPPWPESQKYFVELYGLPLDGVPD